MRAKLKDGGKVIRDVAVKKTAIANYSADLVASKRKTKRCELRHLFVYVFSSAELDLMQV